LQGDEWEEKWGEHYWSKGKAEKWADKWGKEGVNVWHEKWGEDYAAGGDACFKYTDKVRALTPPPHHHHHHHTPPHPVLPIYWLPPTPLALSQEGKRRTATLCCRGGDFE